jgi:hypothetical protein
MLYQVVILQLILFTIGASSLTTKVHFPFQIYEADNSEKKDLSGKFWLKMSYTSPSRNGTVKGFFDM